MLRPYQILFCDKIAIALFKHKSIIAQSPTGSGKTVMMASLIKRYIDKFPNDAVFICVHRFELVAQTANKLNNVGIKSFEIISGVKHVPPGQRVYICMVETLNNLIDKLGFKPNFLICDEVHLANHFKIIDAYKLTSLILGLSATPVSNKKKPLKNYFSEIVIGPSVKVLIDDKFLSPPATFSRAGNIDKKKLQLSHGEYSESSQFAQLGNKKQLMNTFLAYSSLAPGKKTVIFNCNVEHNNAVTDYFNDNLIPCRSVDGTTDAATRTDIFRWFRETDGAVLSNVGVATTGFDEPTVECIILNFITKSLAKYIQCVGRGSRPSPGKDHFRIIDLGGNYEEFGLWEHPQDWHELFHNPEKPGTGPAPTKICPNEECGNIIHLSATVCEYCGELIPRENNYDEKPIDFACIGNYKGPKINIERAISNANEHGHNSYAPLMKLLDSSVNEARKVSTIMTPELEKKIKESVYGPAAIFYKSLGKEFRGSHKGFVNKIITQKIQLLFA